MKCSIGVHELLQDTQVLMIKRAYVNAPIDDPKLANAQIAEIWIKETVKEVAARLSSFTLQRSQKREPMTCPTCNRQIVIVDEPLCPVCAAYVPEAWSEFAKRQEALITAAKAALKYVDDLNEDTPVEPECKECVGRVYFDKGTPEPPLCWIHQLEAAVKGE